METAAGREHGTHSGYVGGCRCDDCREAHNEYTREHYRRKMRELDPSWTPTSYWRGRRARHGTTSRYGAGCRCEQCREAVRADRRRRRERDGIARAESASVRSLVECMVAFGVSKGRIAKAAGCSYKTVQLKRPAVRRKTAEAFARLHWAAWRASERFRFHCGCPVPEEVAASIRPEAAAERAERRRKAGLT